MDYKKLTKIADGRDNVVRLDSDLVTRWNDYCERAYYSDDMIFSMDEFDELMSGMSPLDIAQRIYFGDFNPNDDWFWYDGRGNLASSNYSNNSPIDFDAIEGDEEEEVEEPEEEVEE